MGLPPGTYSVTIGDQTNCQSEVFTFILESPELIQYDYYSSQEISCYNSCDASVSVFTANYENELFYWFDASDSVYIGNSNTLSNLCDGSYFFAIENEQNCYINSSQLGVGNLTFENPDEFNITLVQSPSTPNGICDEIASVVSTSGVSPVSFEWSTGETASTIDSLCVGNNYSVVATDANGCQSFIPFVVNPGDCNFSIDDISVTQPSCHNIEDGKIISSTPFQNGYPPYTIYFSKDDTPISEEITYLNNISFTNLSEGNYYLIVKDAGNCLATFNTNITNPSPLSYSYTIENINCYNSFDPEVHISITGGTPFDNATAYDVNFFDFEHFISYENGGIETFVSGNNIVPGSYPLIVTDSNNCTSPLPPNQMFTIDVNDVDSIIVDVQTSSPRCYGEASGEAILSFTGGQGPFEIYWYVEGELTPFNDSSVVLNNLNAGNYSVTIIDSINCTATANFSIIDTLEFT